MTLRYAMQLGLPETLVPQAAALYWQAFGGKLGVVMGPESRALHYLARVIRRSNVIVALDEDGRLIGLAGFKTPEGSFAAGGPADLRASYGLIGGTWRARMLGWLASDIDNENFLLDGLCVLPELRGLGIGSALMEAICDEARHRGYPAVRLDVVDSNWRAQALYRRLGFEPTHSQGIGLLRLVFGFASATTMVKLV